MKTWPRPALLALVMLYGGCASLGPLQEPPVVSLAAIESIAAEGLEQRYRLRLRIKNPNPEPLPLAGVSFRLVVNGETFADGVSPADVTIEPFSEAVLPMEATSSLYRVYRQLTRMPDREGRPLEWRVEGSLSIRGRLGNVPFEAKGELGGASPGPG
jgi:LEA14-like dessication related protein